MLSDRASNYGLRSGVSVPAHPPPSPHPSNLQLLCPFKRLPERFAKLSPESLCFTAVFGRTALSGEHEVGGALQSFFSTRAPPDLERAADPDRRSNIQQETVKAPDLG